MTPAEARQALTELSTAISIAAMALRPHVELMRRFQNERQRMESIGPILAPSLYNSSERIATDAILSPLYNQALTFIETYDRQLDAVKKALKQVQS